MTLIVSSYAGYLAFSGQLKRYEENPTVLSIEIMSEGEFDRPAFTICSDYVGINSTEDFVTE